MFIEELIKDYKKYVIEHNKTLFYYNYIQNYYKFLYDNKLDNIDNMDNLTKNYISDLVSSTYKNGSKNNILKSINYFYNYLEYKDLIEENNIERYIKFYKYEKKDENYIDYGDLSYIIKKATYHYKSFNPYKLKAILYFVYFTGVTLEELTDLKREDIDLEKSLVNIVKINPSKLLPRTIYYPKQLNTIWKLYFNSEKEKTNAFCLDAYQIIVIRTILKKYCLRKKHLTFNLLRDSYANNLARNNIPVNLAQKLLGHRRIDETLLYYKFQEDNIESIYRENLERRFKNIKTGE